MAGKGAPKKPAKGAKDPEPAARSRGKAKGTPDSGSSGDDEHDVIGIGLVGLGVVVGGDDFRGRR